MTGLGEVLPTCVDNPNGVMGLTIARTIMPNVARSDDATTLLLTLRRATVSVPSISGHKESLSKRPRTDLCRGLEPFLKRVTIQMSKRAYQVAAVLVSRNKPITKSTRSKGKVRVAVSI